MSHSTSPSPQGSTCEEHLGGGHRLVGGWACLLPLLWCDGARVSVTGSLVAAGEVTHSSRVSRPAQRAVSDSHAGAQGGPGGGCVCPNAEPHPVCSVTRVGPLSSPPWPPCGDSLRSLGPSQLSREDWDKRVRAEGSADASCGPWGSRTPHHSSIALPRPASWGVCKHVHVCHAGQSLGGVHGWSRGSVCMWPWPPGPADTLSGVFE